MILGARTYTIEREAAGTVSSAGIFTPGASSTFTVRASWQPMTGREREQLPEGDRTRASGKLYCDAIQTPLRTAAPQGGPRCDVVQRDGRRYEVISELDWSDHASPTAHRSYVLAEIGLDEGGRR